MALFVWLQNVTQVFNQFVSQFSSRLELRRDRMLTKDSMAQVNPVGLDAIGWKYYFLFWSILIFLLVIIIWKFPETKLAQVPFPSFSVLSLMPRRNSRGRTLEEVALIFDGDNALGDATVDEHELEKGGPKGSIQHVEESFEKDKASL